MIVITAPTGQIGHQVLDTLLARQADVRVIVRDPLRLPATVRERVELVPGSHQDPQVIDRAFTGADAVFWLVPADFTEPDPLTRYVRFSRAACEAFGTHGVRRVVGVSALGRDTPLADRAGLVTASLAMDDAIARTGVSYRALALPGFMDNALRHLADIRDRGVFSWPTSADVTLPTCATRDIAAVAAELLLDGDWTGVGSVPVLGPEDLSHDDEARIMSEVLGRPIRFEPIHPDAYLAGLVAQGASEAMAHAVLEMIRAKEQGLDNAERRTPQSSSPTSFAQWCEEVLKPALAA